MSDTEVKEYRSKRIHKDEVKAMRQYKFAKKFYKYTDKPPHYYSKRHSMNCGNPNCVMCGNPRKFFGEKTVQEKSFEQTERWIDE